jgi:hypothetical protein
LRKPPRKGDVVINHEDRRGRFCGAHSSHGYRFSGGKRVVSHRGWQDLFRGKSAQRCSCRRPSCVQAVQTWCTPCNRAAHRRVLRL